MKKLFPRSNEPMVAASILLANVYAASGELEKSSDIRRQLQRSGKKKKPGLAWTAVNGQLYVSITHSPETTEMILFHIFSASERMIDLILDRSISMQNWTGYPTSC